MYAELQRSSTAVFHVVRVLGQQTTVVVQVVVSYRTARATRFRTHIILCNSHQVWDTNGIYSRCTCSGEASQRKMGIDCPRQALLSTSHNDKRRTSIYQTYCSCSRFIATIWSNAHHGDGAACLLHTFGCCLNSRHRECRTTV